MVDEYLLFSVVDYKLYVNNDENNKWFDIDYIENLNTTIQLIPLFNNVSHPERDIFDQTVFSEIKIVISLLEFEGDGELSRELTSFEYPLEGGFEKENIYEINLKIGKNIISEDISKEFSYALHFSYYIEDEEKAENDIFIDIMNNRFFVVTIPFIKDGGWLNGK